jgi:hypothetical protein
MIAGVIVKSGVWRIESSGGLTPSIKAEHRSPGTLEISVYPDLNMIQHPGFTSESALFRCFPGLPE